MEWLSVSCHSCGQVHLYDELLVKDDNSYCFVCFHKTFATCEECGKYFLKEGLKEVSGYHGRYCKDCYNEKFTSCDKCGEIFAIDETVFCEDDTYCEDCYSDLFSTCEKCGETCVIEDMTAIDGDYYCSDCRDNNFVICESCQEYVHIENYYNVFDYCYCESCFSQSFSYCEECQEVERNENMFEVNGIYVCRYCYENMETTSAQIRDYGYKPSPVFHSDNSEDKLFFGVELEVDTDYRSTASEIAEKLYEEDLCSFRGDDFCYFKEDGSLKNGLEIVTHPFSWSVYERQLRTHFETILSICSNNGGSSYDAKTCGIHIHISKKGFLTSSHLIRFLKFFNKIENYPFVHAISQRKHNCSGNCQWGLHHSNDGVAKLAKKAIKDRYTYTNRYATTNVENSETIEVRIFRGTLNKSSFHKNIEFVKAVFEFTKEAKNSYSIDSFKKYVLFNSGSYPNLLYFLENEIERFMTVSSDWGHKDYLEYLRKKSGHFFETSKFLHSNKLFTLKLA
jgi:hypothetical protein